MKSALVVSMDSIRRALFTCLCTFVISGCSSSVVSDSNATDTGSGAQIEMNDAQNGQSELVAPATINNQPSADGQVPVDVQVSVNLDNGELPQIVQARLEIRPIKTFRIMWPTSSNAEFYRVLENPDAVSGFSSISEDLDASTLSFDHTVALFSRVNASYIVQACNTNGCVDSDPLEVAGSLNSAIGYIKASNTDAEDIFGFEISLSADGNTLAVAADRESSAAMGINGDQADNSIRETGAVYVFVRNNGLWQQQAYLKASNTGERYYFGSSVSISADGNTLAVGSVGDRSSATGINGDQTDATTSNTDTSFSLSGSVYVFERSNGSWQQQAYIKGSNTGRFDNFGNDVSVSADGNTLAVGAFGESSAATGINGNQADNSASSSGAVYVFVRGNESWQQQAYIKASNADGSDLFSRSISLSADGNTLAVGAHLEDSASTGINGNETDNSAEDSGAVYVFVRSNELWGQQAYLKASNTEARDFFGRAVSLSGDGNTLAVGAFLEDSGATGINGDQSDNWAKFSGAVYVFARGNGLWQQQAYLKASNADLEDRFGRAVSLSADGNILAVGAEGDSVATGINGDQSDNSENAAGSVYVFARGDGLWQQQAYIKATNTEDNDEFGVSVSLSANGNTLAVGAWGEESGATGINGDTTDESATDSGAVYLY